MTSGERYFYPHFNQMWRHRGTGRLRSLLKATELASTRAVVQTQTVWCEDIKAFIAVRGVTFEEGWKLQGGKGPSSWGEWGRLHGGSGTWVGCQTWRINTLPTWWPLVWRWTQEATASGRCDHMRKRGTLRNSSPPALLTLETPHSFQPLTPISSGKSRVTVSFST